MDRQAVDDAAGTGLAVDRHLAVFITQGLLQLLDVADAPGLRDDGEGLRQNEPKSAPNGLKMMNYILKTGDFVPKTVGFILTGVLSSTSVR